MFRIKKLYLFILQTFLPLFLMTFFICLFIVLMQFVFRYIDEMVGKGLSMEVLGELFFYAGITCVPLALPLSILLASLITFGNLGERMELTAMKAAGISLMQIMRPLIIFVSLISVGAFFFQNDLLPMANMKMSTLLISMRQKSPELDIPEGVFYDDIAGYNLYVKRKDRKTGMLYDVMIYDVSKGFNDAMIIVADSGKLQVTDDKLYLFLTLYNGESFENLKAQRAQSQNIPYRRETFSLKEILIEFDANFNMVDESIAGDSFAAKDIRRLRSSIDSLNSEVDSLGVVNAKDLRRTEYFRLYDFEKRSAQDTVLVAREKPLIDLDSIYATLTPQRHQSVTTRALTRAETIRGDFDFKSHLASDVQWYQRRYKIEIHRKFTLSFACLVFFFIAAPLGAIIRKGGLGLPAVISVIFFIFYYIIDNLGYKMARDAVWNIWVGVWFSSVILLPIGIFLTYKAVHDSAVFNSDTYLRLMRSLFGRVPKREVQLKEVVINEADSAETRQALRELTGRCEAYRSANGTDRRQSFVAYFTAGYDMSELRVLGNKLESFIEYASNTRDPKVIRILAAYPVLRRLWVYRPFSRKWAGGIFLFLFPFSVPLYLFGTRMQGRLNRELEQILSVSRELEAALGHDSGTGDRTPVFSNA